MKRILTYQVFPTIPESLSFLEVLSRNLWWCWKPDAVELFRRIDPLLWKSAIQVYISPKKNIPSITPPIKKYPSIFPVDAATIEVPGQ